MNFRDADVVALLSCTDSCSTRVWLIEVLGLVVAFSAHVLGLQETRHPEGGMCIGLRPLLPPPVTLCISATMRGRSCGGVRDYVVCVLRWALACACRLSRVVVLVYCFRVELFGCAMGP